MNNLHKLKKIMNSPFAGRLMNEDRTPINLNSLDSDRLNNLLYCFLKFGSDSTIKIINEL